MKQFRTGPLTGRVPIGGKLPADETVPKQGRLRHPAHPGLVGARVRYNGDQTITTATTTTLAFDTEDFDTHAFHDNATNNSRLTIPSGYGGVYLLGGAVETDSTAMFLFLRLNGNPLLAAEKIDVYGHLPTTPYALEEGDYVELLVRQNSGGDQTVYGTASAYAPVLWAIRQGGL